jgi:hypothetical protein
MPEIPDDPDTAKAERAFTAMLGMKKLDIEARQRKPLSGRAFSAVRRVSC